MPVAIHSTLRHPPTAVLRKLRSGLEDLLAASGKNGALLEVELVGAGRIRSLNRRFRHKDKVTDVLSFPMHWTRPHRGVPWLLGSISIALPVAVWQARRGKRRAPDQVLRLAVHAWVHLSGLDHERGAREAKKFERAEVKFLRLLQRKGLLKWLGSWQF